jgi:hypothetical protein
MLASLSAGFVLLLLESVATASPAASTNPPLRTVIYKISTQQQNAAYMERYMAVDNNRAIFVDEGTATVDIMVNTEEALGMRVTELTRSRGYPAQFLGNVAADGFVHFADDSISDPTRELLPFFGVGFVAQHSLDVGETWQTATGDVVVRKVESKRVTLEITERFKVANSVADVRAHGTVVYDPGLLVPISGDIVRTRRELHPEGAIEVTELVHFERLSDTFEPPASN